MERANRRQEDAYTELRVICCGGGSPDCHRWASLTWGDKAGWRLTGVMAYCPSCISRQAKVNRGVGPRIAKRHAKVHRVDRRVAPRVAG